MTKKKKTKLKGDISLASFALVKENLIKKINNLLKENFVTIGATAVLRLLNKDKLGLVVASKKMCSPLFHEINLICEYNKVPVLSIEEEFIKNIEAKTSRISILGIKKEFYAKDKELEQYVQKLQKKKKRKELDELQSQVIYEIEKLKQNDMLSNSDFIPISSCASTVNYISSKVSSTAKALEKAEVFISLKNNSNDEFKFPEYKRCTNSELLNISIKDNDGLSLILG